jgi:hypothetical protein
MAVRKVAEHGTRARYLQGCHCDRCKSANARYELARRKGAAIDGRIRRIVADADGKPLTSPRQRYCSKRCAKAAERDRKRDNQQVSGGPDGFQLATRNATSESDRDFAGVAFPVARKRQSNATTRRSEAKSREERREEEEPVAQVAEVAQTTSEIGPCARCRRACHRYGDGGNPLCDDCRTGDRP